MKTLTKPYREMSDQELIDLVKESRGRPDPLLLAMSLRLERWLDQQSAELTKGPRAND